jgi:phosphatidylglycerol:prolipoprotein diacylglycerol transferase
MPAPPNPVAFVIPGLSREVYWYGILVTLGTLMGAFVADREARRRGLNTDHVWNLLIVVMVFGLVGARLYHVVSSPGGEGSGLGTYLSNPISIISFWDGGLRGLGVIGAIVGGVIGVWLYVWEHNHAVLARAWRSIGKPRRRRGGLEGDTDVMEAEPLIFSEWADIGALALPIGQAIGRWGNYFNQELYGHPTTLPWGVPVADAYRLPQYVSLPASTRFQPTFLYESLWCIGVFLVLAFVARRWTEWLLFGDLALLYLILYPLGRYLVELQRPDAWTVGGVPVAQVISVLTMAGAALVLLARHGAFARRAAEPVEPVEP